MRGRGVRAILPIGVLAVVVALAALPMLSGRYPFFLDFVAGPGWEPLAGRLFGFEPPVYGGSLPLYGLLSLAPPDIAATALVPGVLAIAAAVGYVALPGPRWARLYGALVLVVNPFVYARILAGQWAVVWGLAMLPLVLWAVTAYLEEPRPRRLLAAVLAITLLGFSAHLLYASTILLGSVVLFRTLDRRDGRPLRRAATVAVVALPVNAYWLVPALVDGGGVGDVPSADMLAYAPHAGDAPLLFRTASMGGFWREGYVFARDLEPAVEGLFVIVLFLAVYGAVSAYDGDRGYVVRALVLSAVVAVLLGAGVHGPAGSAVAWFAETVPLFGGMRDSNKFVALLVLAYAYLGALGVRALVDTLCTVEWPLRTVESPGLGDTLGGFDGRRVLAGVVLVAVLATPLAYTFPMVTGYAGQVSAGDYPPEWDEVEDHLAADDGESAVLFLPWHQYLDLSWLDGDERRVRTPARQFFSRPVVQGDNVEIGPVYSTSNNPVSAHVEATFGLGPGEEPATLSHVGEALAAANVEYVLVAKEVDWRAYDEYLTDAEDLTLALENDRFRVYRNDRPVARAVGIDRIAPDRVPANASSPVGADGGDPLAVTQRSPPSHDVAGTDRPYTAVARSQARAGDGWRYDGRAPVGRHRGVAAVYPSASDGGRLRYAPFYRLYLPSYAISGLAVLALVWYGLARRPGPAVRERLQRGWHAVVRGERS